MSAIFGLVHLDGRPAAERDLDTMGIALAAHGPDGNGVWTGEHVGLGQRLMCFTPEDRLERQPLIGAGGHHVLVADGRIDNRPELMHELGIASPEAGDMPDSAFILRSYQKWGAGCCSRLIGDFVFALCDSIEGHVLIARSAMSTRTLYYHAASGVFAFASAPKGLFALPWIPREIDEQSLADYLVWVPRGRGRTLFAGLSELRAGQAVVVRREGFRLQEHWQPDVHRETRFPRDSDYVEAFNALFNRVLADNVRSLTPVGAMMSGGLDSSSVAVAAAPLLASRGERLATFTEIPRAGFELPLNSGRYADETPFVEAIARKCGNLDLNFVRTEGCFVLDDIDPYFFASEAPFRSVWNRTWYEAILRQAGDRGVRAVLTGGIGNLTASRTGDGLLPRLIRRGKWTRAFSEARAWSRQNGGTSAFQLLARGAGPLLPLPLWLAAKRLLRPGNPVFRAGPPWQAYSPIDAEFARAQLVMDRAREGRHDFYDRAKCDTPVERYDSLQRSMRYGTDVSGGFEARFGVQCRNPLGDARVVQFCFSLPEEQFQSRGMSRSLIRRAMENRLPPEVLVNPRRGLQAADWFEQFNTGRSRVLHELARIERSEVAARALDLKRIRGLVEQMPGAGTGTGTLPMNCRAVIGSALMTGSFLRWFECSGRGRV